MTVTYAVKVHDRSALGNGTLANFVGVRGEPVPAACAEGSPTCTVNGVKAAVEPGDEDNGNGSDGSDDEGDGSGPSSLLPDTGGPVGHWTLPIAVVLVAGGLVLLRAGSRRKHPAAPRD